MRSSLIAATLVCLALLGACASNGQKGNAGANAPLVTPITIVGTWKIVSVEGPEGTTLPPSDVPQPTIQFDPPVGAAGGRVELFTGINRGLGRYTFSPGERDVAAISLGSFSMTRKAGPPEAMHFETLLTQALDRLRTASKSNGETSLDCGDFRVRLAPHA
ncbi:MAG: META domain-containing protein [Phycisphaerales bacterium]